MNYNIKRIISVILVICLIITGGIVCKSQKFYKSNFRSEILEKIYSIDSKLAIKLAEDIASNCMYKNPQWACDSLNILSKAVLEKKLEISDVKPIYNNIMTSQKTIPLCVKNSAGFLLINTKTFEGVKIILQSDIDEFVKVACVSQNLDVIKAQLQDITDSEDIEIIKDAMEIFPEKSIIQYLDSLYGGI